MLELLRAFGLDKPASAHGAQIDHVLVLVHWLMILLGVGWGLYFIYVLFRYRKTANPTADYVGAKGKLSKWLEIGVVVFEAILLLGFSIPFWAEQVDAKPEKYENAMRIHVVAQQFAWNIHYPGKDGIFGATRPELVDSAVNPLGLDEEDPAAADDITTINDLVVPVNQKIVIDVTSKDVIHSFFLPPMRVKQDAIPGMVVPVVFTPIETGNWQIACAQLCGNGHYRMLGQFRVMDQDAYESWMQEQIDYKKEDSEDEDEE